MSSKQEEIRLQAYRLFCQHCQALQKTMDWKSKELCWVIQYNEPRAVCASAIDAIDGLFAYLVSKGGVLTVERELPDAKWIEEWLLNRLGTGNIFEQFNRQFCKDLIKDAMAGYKPVEPLIEEKK